MVLREMGSFNGGTGVPWLGAGRSLPVVGRNPLCYALGTSGLGHSCGTLSCILLTLQPFWPLGTGVARGFLAAFDAAWMVKRWAEGAEPLEVLAER